MVQPLWPVALMLQVLASRTTPSQGFSQSYFGKLPIAQQWSIREESFSSNSLFAASATTLFMVRRDANNRAPVLADKPPMNEEITAPELRVLTPNSRGKDEPLGILSRADALAKAQELGGLDLILVNPNSDPPVCKIVDYSKYRYMQEKKAKEVKKNSKASEIKEVKMSYKIDVHDYEVRKKNALKFLKQGNRVKCSVMFRGREVQHDNLGYDLLDRLATEMEEVCVREGRPKREGRNLAMIVSPRPEVLKAVNDYRRATEKEKKKKKTEAKEQKAAGMLGSDDSSTELNGSFLGLDDDDDEDEMDELSDIEADIESSLDDLFGSDDLTDDLFS